MRDQDQTDAFGTNMVNSPFVGLGFNHHDTEVVEKGKQGVRIEIKYIQTQYRSLEC